MKWLVILVLFLLLALYVAYRYRRQIQAMVQIWRMFRQFKEQTRPPAKQVKKEANLKEVPLVRCSRCGTWVPQTNALQLRSKTVYCSTACMEQAVNPV